jgi:hypothetical protein
MKYFNYGGSETMGVATSEKKARQLFQLAYNLDDDLGDWINLEKWDADLSKFIEVKTLYIFWRDR